MGDVEAIRGVDGEKGGEGMGKREMCRRRDNKRQQKQNHLEMTGRNLQRRRRGQTVVIGLRVTVDRD